MTILVFDDVSKRFGDTVALDRVSLAVEAGEVFGLLGPNGAGKTTLIRVLMDIIRPDEGAITLFGERHRRSHLERVGYLPEERGLYVKHKVLEVMVYLGNLKGLSRAEARRRARVWLERLDLGHTERWKIERLSKGMTQKVQIASSLLHEPELCVLDEPFSGLDPVNVRLVQTVIEERRAAGRTTILSTHQMDRVQTLCDRLAMIHRGRRVVYGGVDEVRRLHSLPEVRLETPDPLPELPGVARTVSENAHRHRLLLDDGTEPQTLLAELVRRGVRLERFERVLAPMEEIFVRVVEEADGIAPVVGKEA